MRDACRILRRDLLRLLKNPLACIVMIGVCLLPSLYAWFNIAANMDPYQNTKNIKVAIVSEDKGGVLNNETINAGDKVIEKVKDNDKLGWVFCSKEEAIHKVYSGDVYASIVIPEDFTEQLLSFTKGEVESPQIDYYVNEKKNAIAPKITDTGASTVQEQINSTFSGVAAQAVSEVIEKTAGQVSDDLADNNKTVLSYVKEISDNITEYQSVLNGFDETMDQARTDLDTTNKNLDQAKQTIDSCKKVTDTVTSDLKDIRKSMSDLSIDLSSTITDETMKLEDAYSSVNEMLSSVEEAAISGKTTINTALTQLNSIVDIDQDLLASYQKQVEEMEEGEMKQQLMDEIAQTQAEITETKALITTMEGDLAEAETVIQVVKDIRTSSHDSIRKSIDALNQYQTGTFFPSINAALDDMASVTGELSGMMEGLEPTIDSLQSIVFQFGDSMETAQDAFSKTSDSLTNVQSRLANLETDLAAMESSELYKTLQNLKGLDAEEIASFMSSPVEIDTEIAYPVENYGSAMSPFFTNLAIWVGGLVLGSILKVEVDKEKLDEISVTSKYFGRSFLFLLMGIVQAVIVCVGDVVLLGVQCVHPGTFILTGVICSIAFTSFIYAMAITFKHIGKALCVFIVILQIPGSGGTYPIEMTPHFFQVIHPFLPFTYGVNAMRECVAGYYEQYLLNNWLALGILLLVALFIGLIIRPKMLNLNYMFDRKLAETDLVAAETDSQEYVSPEKKILFTTLLRQDVVRLKAEQFERNYKKMIRGGFSLMAITGLLFLILMFSLESKLVFLTLWVGCILALCLYLLSVEYLHTKLQQQLHTIDEEQVSDGGEAHE